MLSYQSTNRCTISCGASLIHKPKDESLPDTALEACLSFKSLQSGNRRAPLEVEKVSALFLMEPLQKTSLNCREVGPSQDAGHSTRESKCGWGFTSSKCWWFRILCLKLFVTDEVVRSQIKNSFSKVTDPKEGAEVLSCHGGLQDPRFLSRS